MKYLFLFIQLLLIFSCSTKPESSVAFYTPKMEFGNYSVGFDTLLVYDITRPAIPYSDWSGRLYKNDETKGRQFQINIWYPTENKNSNQLKLKDYINLTSLAVDFQTSTANLSFGRSEIISKIRDLGGSDSTNLSALDDHFTNAFSDVQPSDSKFPLVVYPNGIAPFTTFTTGEFLASYGYVVVSFQMKGKEASTIDASSIGADIAADDLKFVLSEVLKLNYIDQNKIALMANAIESSFCIAHQVNNPAIDAFISLEGGFISNFEQTILEGIPSYQPANINIPILSIYAPHASIKPEHIRKLVYSDRYFAHFPFMREHDFLSFGLFESLIPNLVGEPKGDTEKGFIQSHLLMLEFLNYTFNSKNFASRLEQFNADQIDTTFYWKSIPPLPSITTIKDQFMKKRLPYLDSLYKAQKSFTPIPFDKAFINDFRNWVAWGKDPKYSARRKLYEMAVESYPESVEFSYSLGYYALNAGDTTLAKSSFENALKKIKLGTDEDLTPDMKKTIMARIENYSTSLN